MNEPFLEGRALLLAANLVAENAWCFECHFAEYSPDVVGIITEQCFTKGPKTVSCLLENFLDLGYPFFKAFGFRCQLIAPFFPKDQFRRKIFDEACIINPKKIVLPPFDVAF